MKYNDIKTSVLAQFAMPNGHKVVPFITGKPGGGKSSVAREIAKELQAIHNIPDSRVVEFNPSLREPTDILGLPQINGDHSKWLPPEEFYTIRKGTGPAVLIIEELSDATMDMQNPLCRVILDRHAGQMPLTDELYIIASGNRTEDKSGAQRLSTKLANRMRELPFEECLDDWIGWAVKEKVDPVLRAFIKWRPELLSSFDPTKRANPTPRSWEDVSRIPTTLAGYLYFEHVRGSVGEGAAAEYCGFRKIYEDLPDIEKILGNPDKAEVPTGANVLYALSAKFVSCALDNPKEAGTLIDKLWPFLQRMPREYVVMIIKEIIMNSEAKLSVARAPFFKEFAMSFSELLLD